MALKANLRKEYQAKRRAYSTEEIELLSKRIAEQFFAHFSVEAGQTVHVFLPLRQRQEINTWLIIEKLWELKVQVAVPVSNSSDFSMTHFLLTPDTQVIENKWGIPEPVNALPIPEAEIDIVLVPLLAFDLQGNRVGYGKGFYDRFLDLLPITSQKVGLSIEPPVDVIDDVHAKDYTLDAVITPQKVWDFTTPSSDEA